MRIQRLVIASAAAVVALVLVGTVTFTLGTPSRLPAPSSRADPDNIVNAIGGPFTMVDDTGKTVTQADFKGKPTVMFFGYTHCPDVCPTTLFDLAGLIKELGPEADKLNYVFVTVDPERDTPETLHDYISAFDDRIVGLTGSEAQMQKMAKEYRVYYRKVPGDDGDYTMDHTASVFLMDDDNRLAGTIDYQESDDVALKKLKNLIAQS